MKFQKWMAWSLGQRVQREMRGKPARKTVKFCGRCGGRHSGVCDLVPTLHGTYVRADIADILEALAR